MLARNVRWGVIYGLAYAVIASVLVGGVAVLQGKTSFAEYGMSLATVILLYFVAGILGGTAVGILRPWTGHPVGATVVGAIVGVPVMLPFFVTMGNYRPWMNIDWDGVFLGAVLIGAPSGYLRWRRSRAKDRTEA